MKYNILKAVEFDACSAKFKKLHSNVQALADNGWWTQPKYDGCFGKVTLRAALSDCHIDTRTEEPIRSCTHIVEELHAKYVASGLPFPAVVIGEVWHNSWKFPQISGAVRQHAPAPELVFVMNDILIGSQAVDFMTSSKSYASRYHDLTYLARTRVGDTHIEIAVTTKVPIAIESHARDLKRLGGFDGAILRNPVSPYAPVPAKDGQLIKVKPILSLDLEVVAAAAEHRDTKLGGCLTVLHRNPHTGSMITTDVGSGLTQSTLGEIMQYVGRYQGQIAEIEFMDYTEDGHLREPRFKGWRHDKYKPDQ